MHNKRLTLLLILTLMVSVYVSQQLPFSRSDFASAVLAQQSIGVYWDSACTKPVSSISWGTLTPGGSKSVAVYVRNEGAEMISLSILPLNWTPAEASDYLRFSWTSTNKTIGPNKVVKVTPKLQVSSNIIGISSFSFAILFQGGSGFPDWDVNQDGKVNIVDITIATLAYGSTPTSSIWDSRADVDGNKIVNVLDLTSIESHFGEQFQ